MTTLHDLIPTKLAAGVWDSLMKYKKSIPNFPQTETCELLIIDRTIDQIAPLIHEWTYDAMCHDLLNMEGNKYVHEIPGKNGGQPERKEVLLEDHDPIWLELRYAHIADMLSCRVEVQSELLQQVLLFMLQNKHLGMVQVCEFLKPLLDFSIIKLLGSESPSSSFGLQLVSSMASFCCSCPSESMPVLMLLTECLKYLPHETSEDYRKLVFVVEHMVEAYIVVLKSLAGEKLWHSGGYEPIIELSRRLCSVQKDLGLQWEPGLSTIMASLFTILVQSELEHEQISISKLLLLILKWKYDKALRYHLKKIRDQKIIPRLRLSRAGHPPKLERFSHYVVRQMGFKDRRIGPDICRLASEYISKYEGFEDDIYAYFENEPDADSLYVKLVEEFERCILSYFGFHWNHCDILISQVLSSDISEPKKKLKNIVIAAT
ncbi:hypothetical protein RYX36_030044, partial [Vicia faba]